MINENEFFREITLRLCGNLEIEKGLQACITYMAQHMPADKLYLQNWEPGLGSMRIVARASSELSERMDLLVPLDELGVSAMAAAGKAYREGVMPSVLIYNRPLEDPVARNLLRALNEPLSSVLSLPLIVEDRIEGALALLSEGNERFDEDHVRLFATLREPFFVAMSNTRRHEEVVKLKDRLADDNRYLNRELIHITGDEIIGADFGLREVMQMVRQVSSTQSPVLLSGETGVGKDVIANAIHLGSSRRDGPFVAVNCGAIPESLLDSELFGHEKGAFTGALDRKRGKFERADGGTILLDEIGEMPLDAQVKLLRVLQNRELERVGGTERISVDIRVIAATNRDLEGMVRAGGFRKDLWFRLNVFPIHVPPLRNRKTDIPALVSHFMDRKARELKLRNNPSLAEGAMADLVAYDWPGNVRELENVLERAMIIHRDQPLRFDDLPGEPGGVETSGSQQSELADTNLDKIVSRHIRKVLDITRGKIHGPGGAGELLGVNPNTLRYRMEKLGIPYKKKEYMVR